MTHRIIFLRILDMLANNKNLKNEYENIYATYLSVYYQLQELKEKSEKCSNEQDHLFFQFKQLEEAKLKSDE